MRALLFAVVGILAFTVVLLLHVQPIVRESVSCALRNILAAFAYAFGDFGRSSNMMGTASPCSLAKSAGLVPSLVVSSLLLYSHRLFYLAQTSGAGQTYERQDLQGKGIFHAQVFADIHLEPAGLAVAPALAAYQFRQCVLPTYMGGGGIESKVECQQLDANASLGIAPSGQNECSTLSCGRYVARRTVFSFSYFYSLVALWRTDRVLQLRPLNDRATGLGSVSSVATGNSRSDSSRGMHISRADTPMSARLPPTAPGITIRAPNASAASTLHGTASLTSTDHVFQPYVRASGDRRFVANWSSAWTPAREARLRSCGSMWPSCTRWGPYPDCNAWGCWATFEQCEGSPVLGDTELGLPRIDTSAQPSCRLIYPGRRAAAFLFLASLVWPHLKLLSLHLAWYLPLRKRLRRNILWLLSSLGKWSFSDVMVMAALLAVLYIDLGVTLSSRLFLAHLLGAGLPPALGDLRLRTHASFRVVGEAAMGQFCLAVLLSLGTGVLVDAVEELVRENTEMARHVLDPTWNVAKGEVGSNGGEAEGRERAACDEPRESPPVTALQRSHLSAPCISVEPSRNPDEEDVGCGVLHKLQSWHVGAFSSSMREGGQSTEPSYARGMTAESAPPVVGTSSWWVDKCGDGGSDSTSGGENLLPAACKSQTFGTYHLAPEKPDALQSRAGHVLGASANPSGWFLRRQSARHLIHVSLVTATGLSLVVALCSPMLRREVAGSFIDEVRDAAAAAGSSADSLGDEFNLLTLALLCGRANDWDYVSTLHALTFLTFVVVGPVFRTASQLVLLLIDLPPATAHRLLGLSRYASVFYGLDVMLVAVPLLQQTVDNMADGMFTPKTFALCRDPACFELQAVPLGGYKWLVLTVVLFYFSGYEGSYTHRYLHSAAHPYDCPPPDCSCCGAAQRTNGLTGNRTAAIHVTMH